MQVKVCPKCKAENKVDNLSCSSCYASLDGIIPTESTKNEEPRPAAPAAAAPKPAAAGMPSAAPAGEAAPGTPQNPYGAPPRVGGPVGAPVGGPPFRERPQPIKSGPNVGAIVLVIILLAGAAFAGWWFFLKGPTPEQVVQTFIKAGDAKDVETVKKCLTKANLSDPDISRSLDRGINLGGKNATPDKPSAVIKGVTMEGSDRALVKVEPTDKSQLPPGMSDFTLDMVVVKDDGKWKIDLRETERVMREKMKQMMREMMQKQMQGMPQGMPK